MALTISELVAHTNQIQEKKVIENVTNDRLLYDKLVKKIKKVEGGRVLRIPIAYALPSAGGWYAKTQSLSTPPLDDFITAAEYDWVNLEQSVGMTKIDFELNKGDPRLFDDWMARVGLVDSKIFNDISSEIYNANTVAANSLLPVGLRTITSASAIAGKINPTDATVWAGTTNAGPTVLSWSTLSNQYANTMKPPDHASDIVMTTALFNKWIQLLQAQQRFGDKSTLASGIDGNTLKFMGADIYPDSQCPSGFVFLLQLDGIVNRDKDMSAVPYLALYAPSSLWMRNMTYEPTASSQDVMVYRRFCTMALGVGRRNRQQAMASVS